MPIQFLLFIFISLTALSLSTLSNAETANIEKVKIKIGAIIPLSGPVPELGETLKQGLLMGLEKSLNENNKFQYELVIEDDSMQATKVATAAKKLIFVDKVDAIISTWSYGGNIVAPLVKNKSILHFSFAWDPNILKAGDNNFLHLLSPKDFLIDFFDIFESNGNKKLGVVYFAEAGSVYCAEEFIRLASMREMNIVIKEEVLSDEDFRTISIKIKKAQPDILFVNLVSHQTELLVKKLREINFKGQITSMTGFDQITNFSLINNSYYISDSYPSALELPKNQILTYGLGNYFDFINIVIETFENYNEKSKPDISWVTNYINNKNSFSSAFGEVYFKDRTAIYPPTYFKIENAERKKVGLEELVKN